MRVVRMMRVVGLADRARCEPWPPDLAAAAYTCLGEIRVRM